MGTSGCELTNEKLSDALNSRTSFGVSDLDAFGVGTTPEATIFGAGIQGVRSYHFIQASNGKYFRPASAREKSSKKSTKQRTQSGDTIPEEAVPKRGALAKVRPLFRRTQRPESLSSKLCQRLRGVVERLPTPIESFVTFADFYSRLGDQIVGLVIILALVVLTLLPLHKMQSRPLFNKNFERVMDRKERRAELIGAVVA